ncbi:cytochrome ubiquinol oxidase subunit I, partial [Parageobacillus thermoglucosidasius]
GFELKDGVITNIEPLAAMFNPATPTKVAHVLTTAYMTSAFILASIAAWHLLRGNRHIYHKKALHLTVKTAFIFSVASALVGDLSGKFLAEYQPEKLAAAEWHFETSTHAPLVMFGTLDENNDVKNAIKIPYALSILAHNYPGAEVKGLNEFPKDEIPPLYIHYLFDLMVTIGVLLTIVSAIYWLGKQLKWKWIMSKPFLASLVAAGPLSMLAIELGWYFAEVGRQPWILRGYMKTAEAATSSGHVDTMLVAFSILYLILGIASVAVLINMFRKNPVEKELAERSLEQGGVS